MLREPLGKSNGPLEMVLLDLKGAGNLSMDDE